MPPSTTGETTLPNGFADDISDIDNDIDLTAPLPLPSVSRSDVSFCVCVRPHCYSSDLSERVCVLRVCACYVFCVRQVLR